MRFWDSSALAAVMLPERDTSIVEQLLADDREVIVWWGTLVECQSSIYRKLRGRFLTEAGVEQAIRRMAFLLEDADRVPPVNQILERAGHLLAIHPLRAADALQLAAALTWCKGAANGRAFVCLEAAASHGCTVVAPGLTPGPGEVSGVCDALFVLEPDDPVARRVRAGPLAVLAAAGGCLTSASSRGSAQ